MPMTPLEGTQSPSPALLRKPRLAPQWAQAPRLDQAHTQEIPGGVLASKAGAACDLEAFLGTVTSGESAQPRSSNAMAYSQLQF